MTHNCVRAEQKLNSRLSTQWTLLTIQQMHQQPLTLVDMFAKQSSPVTLAIRIARLKVSILILHYHPLCYSSTNRACKLLPILKLISHGLAVKSLKPEHAIMCKFLHSMYHAHAGQAEQSSSGMVVIKSLRTSIKDS